MNKEKYSSPVFAHDYFAQNMLPTQIMAKTRTYGCDGYFEQHDDEVELLFIRGGSGSIAVNERTYRLSQGDMFALKSYHFHKLTADKGSLLEVTECHVNSGMGLYVAACPYYLPSRVGDISTPTHVIFDAAATSKIESLTQRIMAETKPNSQKSFYYIMRIFGLMERYSCVNGREMDKDKFAVVPRAK